MTNKQKLEISNNILNAMSFGKKKSIVYNKINGNEKSILAYCDKILHLGYMLDVEIIDNNLYLINQYGIS